MDYLIGMWYGIRKEFLKTQEDMEYRVLEAKQAGFTMLEIQYDRELNLKMLKVCEKFGLKASVRDPAIDSVIAGCEDREEKIGKIVETYKDEPALWGYMIKDEPLDDQFENLGWIAKKFRELDPAHVPFINMFPNLAIGDARRYEEHVRGFIEKIEPSIISYDHYSFLKREVKELTDSPEAYISPENREKNGWQGILYEKYNREGFFDNLELARRLSKEYGIPWMTIIMLVEHWHYRYLNEAELRWEAFNALAYGPQSIWHFTYWTPAGTGEGWSYHHAAIEKDGSRDPHYYDIKNVNKDLLLLGGILRECDSEEVFHVGEEKDTVKPFEPYGGIEEIDAYSLTAGFFSAPDGKEYVLLVNKDIEESQSIVIRSQAALFMLDKNTGEWEPLPSINGIYFMEMEAGDGELLEIHSL